MHVCNACGKGRWVQNLNDAGVAGTTINFGSVTLLEFYPRFTYEYGKGSNFTWGFYMAGQNDIVKFTQGASYEGAVDFKGGLSYEANANSPELKLTSSYVAVGVPLYEARYQHDHIHGGGIFKHGFQEDISKSFNTPTGMSFGAKAAFNIQATQRFK